MLLIKFGLSVTYHGQVAVNQQLLGAMELHGYGDDWL